MKQKALLIGDYELAKYHNLKGVDEKLDGILGECFDVTCTEDYSVMSDGLDEYDLVICYGERPNYSLDDDMTAGLLSYTAKGGGILVIHFGISFSTRHEFYSMVGAKFKGHPESCQLDFAVDKDCDICAGVDDFSMHEEPYQFEYAEHVEKDVFLTYEYDGSTWEAGWAIKFGKGRVIYLHPGHALENFDNPSCNKLMLNSAMWCAK